MKKIVLFLAVLMVLPVQAMAAANLGGYTSPSPFRVISTISNETPDIGEFVVDFSIEQSAEPDYYRYMARLAIGMWENLELGVNVPYFEGNSSSFENVTFGAKHRLLDESRHAFSGAYVLSFAVPVREDANSTDGAGGVGIVLSKRVGPVQGHLNFSYNEQLDRDLNDEWCTSMGFEFSAARGLKVLAEIYTIKPMHNNEDSYLSEARFAYRFEGDDNLFAMVGVGVGLTRESSDYRFFASISKLFESGEFGSSQENN